MTISSSKRYPAGTEHLLVKDLLKMLRARHASFAEKLHGSAYMRVGLPDIICCYRGRFIAIEAKTGHNAPTAAQALVLSEIQRARGVAIAVYSVAAAEQALDALDRTIDADTR